MTRKQKPQMNTANRSGQHDHAPALIPLIIFGLGQVIEESHA